jgi:hypothetical protein
MRTHDEDAITTDDDIRMMMLGFRGFVEKKRILTIVFAFVLLLLISTSCDSKPLSEEETEKLLTLENKIDYPSGVHEEEEIFEYFQVHNDELDLMMERFEKYGESVKILIEKYEGEKSISAQQKSEDIYSKVLSDKELMKVCKEFLETDFIKYIEYDSSKEYDYLCSIKITFTDPTSEHSTEGYPGYTYHGYVENFGINFIFMALYEFDHVTGDWWYSWMGNV